MKKIFALVIISMICCLSVFAGDVAAFCDLGFSSDNNTYIFAQYGRTDKNFNAFAEIYTVDIEKNDFVSGGVFKATDKTGKTGKELFSNLKDKANSFLSKYNVKPITPDSVLYVRVAAAGPSTDMIVFKDFEHSTVDNPISYNVRLMPLYEGNGNSTQSSFYIVVERKDVDGKLLSRQVIGNPDIKRKGVINYTIDQIFTTPDGKGIVFLVAKTISNKSDISIRFMVETAKLNPIEK